MTDTTTANTSPPARKPRDLAREGAEARSDAERLEFIREAQSERDRWSGYVGTLLGAAPRDGSAPPSLAAGLEALRNKCDTTSTKVEALARHRDRDWVRACAEYARAREELHRAWRSVISILNRESLFA